MASVCRKTGMRLEILAVLLEKPCEEPVLGLIEVISVAMRALNSHFYPFLIHFSASKLQNCFRRTFKKVT